MHSLPLDPLYNLGVLHSLPLRYALGIGGGGEEEENVSSRQAELRSHLVPTATGQLEDLQQV